MGESLKRTKARVLIIEDEPGAVDLIGKLLEPYDYEVVPALSGVEGLKLLHNAMSGGIEPIDVVLLDILMPEMDGVSVCRAIREELSLSTLPIIAVTALDTIADRVAVFDAGANDYLVKPFDGRELRARIGVAVERKRLHEAAQQHAAKLKVLHDASLEISEHLELDDLLRAIVDKAVELLGAKAGGIYVRRPDLDVLEWRYSVGIDPRLNGARLRRGEGLSGKVWERSSPVIVDDYQNWEGRAPIYEGYPWTAVVGAPLMWRGELLGVLNVLCNARERTFSQEDADLLSLFAYKAGVAIANARLYEEAQARVTQMRSLLEISRGIAGTLDLERTLSAIMEAAIRAVPNAQKGSLHLLDEASNRLVIRASVGFSQETIEAGTFAPDEGYAGWVFSHQKAQVIGDAQADPRTKTIGEAESERIRSALCVPLAAGGRKLGTISLDNVKRLNAFSPQDLEVLSLFAAQAAVAIENARLYENLVRSDQLKALILDIVSHDLRNPLTHVKSYVEMIAEGYLSEDDLPHAIEMMEQAVERMENLLDDLVELQRVEVGQEAEENVDLIALAREVIETHQPDADAKGHQTRMIFDKEPLVVRGRRMQLRQAISNLVTNAIKYTPPGGTITLAVKEEAEEVRLSVTDTGIGIAPEHLPRLFRPFYRVPQPGEKRERGTGLGLSLVKRVVESHGGRVRVESQPGVGSTFGFYLLKPKHPLQDG